MIQQMLAIWSLVPLPLLNLAWMSGISRFMYCWSLAWRILSITMLSCEMMLNTTSEFFPSHIVHFGFRIFTWFCFVVYISPLKFYIWLVTDYCSFLKSLNKFILADLNKFSANSNTFIFISVFINYTLLHLTWLIFSYF